MDFQGTLFAPDADETTETYERVGLTRGAWVDISRSWLPDPDDVFEAMINDVPWREERRQMYDRVVDVPRLLHTYLQGDPLPHPRLAEARGRLTAHYLPELGEPFVTAGCCYYRDGNDSVAWHGDRIGRGRSNDTMVAIVSVGDPRRLALRPQGGGKGMSIEMGHGDLVVMGGSCQRTWEHAIPKVSSAGPRISIQFRPRNVF
ncbi:alkylated DNA repair dioxygenase AlkB [Nocardioides luteus]|uniref:Alkylated DNA repair protein n=1 Tax=Nocardioides luteus TaxID=1844 RepID=A0ABQ5SW82_9ACTN|nr:alpha-ketoglutarate-dependent dioxygenase AlkB [Nocardioides luteus]MDR7312181.1 alkylated DNA repair dioxygenase AlkB [Nocardioides luteus]GGR56531.1 alkylated DNA repair protein [Nocardioides luteus]GLJ68427.1 alkylated DNA repair protein [Nocardioides luteus]